MKTVNIKKEVPYSMNEALDKVEAALKNGGFGVLTRIDFDKKIKEKLGKDMSPVVILGACNPNLAYEAFLRNKDVTSLLPCNVVLRELAPKKVSVEVAKPTAMMEILGDQELVTLAKEADLKLGKILEEI